MRTLIAAHFKFLELFLYRPELSMGFVQIVLPGFIKIQAGIFGLQKHWAQVI
jgi:hypothetical protein